MNKKLEVLIQTITQRNSTNSVKNSDTVAVAWLAITYVQPPHLHGLSDFEFGALMFPVWHVAI